MKIKQKMVVAIPKYNDDPTILPGTIVSDDFWTVLGKVEVEVDFDMPSQKEINGNKIAALRDKLKKERADFQVKKERIEDEIQSLMALEVIYE